MYINLWACPWDRQGNDHPQFSPPLFCMLLLAFVRSPNDQPSPRTVPCLRSFDCHPLIAYSSSTRALLHLHINFFVLFKIYASRKSSFTYRSDIMRPAINHVVRSPWSQGSPACCLDLKPQCICLSFEIASLSIKLSNLILLPSNSLSVVSVPRTFPLSQSYLG
jgi:hypothetical protein